MNNDTLLVGSAGLALMVIFGIRLVLRRARAEAAFHADADAAVRMIADDRRRNTPHPADGPSRRPGLVLLRGGRAPFVAHDGGVVDHPRGGGERGEPRTAPASPHLITPPINESGGPPRQLATRPFDNGTH